MLSQLHIIASNCAPAIPAVPASQAQQLAKPTCKEEKSKVLSESASGKHTFMLVPNIQYVRHFYKKITGFDLIVKNVTSVGKDDKVSNFYEGSFFS